MCLKAYLLLTDTGVVLTKDYPLPLSGSMFTVVTGCGRQRWVPEGRFGEENVNEISEGLESHSGSVFTRTLPDYLGRINTDKISFLVCVGPQNVKTEE